MTEKREVVIAGAGPNGLMLACELALAGIMPVVLDALPGASPEPKANGLVGQVVRMLDMRGLYSGFTGQDRPQPLPGWMFSGMQLSYPDPAASPMYAMMMPQPQLVRLLEKRARELGVDLRWGHELAELQPGDDGVALSIATADGVYRMTAGYLVGADGGRSMVRKSVGIGFPGTTSETVGRLAQVEVPDEFRAPDGGLNIPGVGHIPFGHNRFDNGMVLAGSFQPGVLLVGTREDGRADEQGPLTIAELRASLQRILGVDVPLQEPSGPGPHAKRRIDGQNTRQADHYRAGRVLLLGDAAHVHSAMGGPGLNLGLQDAVNLGWKLAAEVNGWAPAGLLDSYETERHPVGQRVIMHSMAQSALMAPGSEVAQLRMLFEELLALPGVSEHVGRLLAGSDVRYDVGDDHPLSGYLVPDLTLDDGRRVADLLHDARPVLIDASGGAVAASAQGWADRVTIVTAPLVDGPVGILVRPDGYVAWAAEEFAPSGARALRAALGRWFGAAA
ncbi:FAD-dependent oxidoreductase [Mycolicibacterium anyangense]|uniref:FAD-dependent oxidoreductase n=1 Tax=Mycolicibacterium anyangense TaxID=1431246 RepID=A0A6N4WCU5_9MYCO|nr:FAD-dependent monooxygenase [Mycolicibacterium anyangense]BBZ79800.1 FAD-dependent oxidoreductase [Mycolicibacterium anyangense]